MNRTQELDQVVRSLASISDEELPSPSESPAAKALLEEITSTEPNGASASAARRRWLERRPPLARPAVGLAGAAATLALAAAAVTSLIGGQPAAAEVKFNKRDGYIVARITDPFADSERLGEAFAEHGLDIDLQLLPVSPSMVGTVVMISENTSGEEIRTLGDGGCVTGGGACPIGLRIPADFSGEASITLGRPAEPGEEFASSADAFGVGEALHCSGLVGVTVERAVPELEARGLTAIWRTYEPATDDVAGVDPAKIADHVVTTGATPNADGEVFIWASQKRTPTASYMRTLNQGC